MSIVHVCLGVHKPLIFVLPHSRSQTHHHHHPNMLSLYLKIKISQGLPGETMMSQEKVDDTSFIVGHLTWSMIVPEKVGGTVSVYFSLQVSPKIKAHFLNDDAVTLDFQLTSDPTAVFSSLFLSAVLG